MEEIKHDEQLLQTDTMDLNIGPHHPATHGVLRIVATLDGERIIKAVPYIGYLHRGVEKLCEDLTYMQITPHFDRTDYVSNINNELSYVMAVEKLAEIKVPERAEFLRVIMLELNRILNHLIWVGSFANDVGLFGTAFMYSFRDRDLIQRVMERVTGARVHYHYLTYGGVREEVHDDFEADVKKLADWIPGRVDEYEMLLEDNEVFRARTIGVGVLDKEEAINYGCSGPFLRSTGVPIDLRKLEPYSVYPLFDFDIPVGKNGDAFDRFKVRMNEMRESAKIIKQAIEGLPGGPIRAKVPRKIRLPKGEVYIRTENTKGEFGVYLVSDGGEKPYRLKLRSPSYTNLMYGSRVVEGMVLPDVVAVLASVDIVLGCIDR
jgi:NADH-quinone oxidoreductase subunit D